MIEDTAGRNHFSIYGKSDKAMPLEIVTMNFRTATPWARNPWVADAYKVIEEEEKLRTEVGDDLGSGFAEWKRGLWAARSQMAAAGITSRNEKG